MINKFHAFWLLLLCSCTNPNIIMTKKEIVVLSDESKKHLYLDSFICTKVKVKSNTIYYMTSTLDSISRNIFVVDNRLNNGIVQRFHTRPSGNLDFAVYDSTTAFFVDGSTGEIYMLNTSNGAFKQILRRSFADKVDVLNNFVVLGGMRGIGIYKFDNENLVLYNEILPQDNLGLTPSMVYGIFDGDFVTSGITAPSIDGSNQSYECEGLVQRYASDLKTLKWSRKITLHEINAIFLNDNTLSIFAYGSKTMLFKINFENGDVINEINVLENYGKIKEIKLYNNNYYINDEKRVVCLSGNGEFIWENKAEVHSLFTYNGKLYSAAAEKKHNNKGDIYLRLLNSVTGNFEKKELLLENQPYVEGYSIEMCKTNKEYISFDGIIYCR